MQNKAFRFGPVALTNTYGTNILNPNITSLAGPVGFTMSQPYIILRHIRIVNKSAGAATYRLFLGATGGTAAGTEVIGYDKSVGVGSVDDWYGAMRIDAADFLTGGASASTALTIEGEGEIGVAG